MRWWDELWLNEGYANWFEQAVTNIVAPDLMIGKQHVQYLSTALHFDGSPDTHAVRPVRRIASDSAIGALFDSISYDKAGAIIYMLHDYLERRMPGKFLKGLKSYMLEHAFGSASGSEMWSHLSHACGLPIGEWIEPWFAQAGYPLIEVTTLSDGSAVLLQTGRFMQDLTRTQMAFDGLEGNDQAGHTQSWWVPISYYTSTSQDVHVGEIVSTSAFFSIPPPRKLHGGFDIDGVDWLKVNFNGAGYYRVNYAPHLWARLVQVASEPGRLSDADLSNLIDDAFALTLDGRLSGVTLSLARSLGIRTAHETAFVTSSYESWQSMSIGLHLLLSLISGATQSGSSQAGLIAGPGLELIPSRCVDDLQRFVRTQTLGRCLDPFLSTPATGVVPSRDSDDDGLDDPVPPTNQLEALAKPVLLSLAATMGDTRVGMWVARALAPCLETPEARCAEIELISPEIRFTCLSICAGFDKSGRCWRLALGQLPYATNDPAYRYSLLAALARAPTYELLNRTISMTMNSSVVRAQDTSSMIAMLARNPKLPRARQLVWQFSKVSARMRALARRASSPLPSHLPPPRPLALATCAPRARAQDNVASLSQVGGADGSFGFSAVLSHVASGFASEEMAQDVEIFVAENPNLIVPPRIVRAVVGRIRSQAIWVQNYGADTCAVLQSWHA
jgi:hypothetical protein